MVRRLRAAKASAAPAAPCLRRVPFRFWVSAMSGDLPKQFEESEWSKHKHNLGSAKQSLSQRSLSIGAVLV